MNRFYYIVLIFAFVLFGCANNSETHLNRRPAYKVSGPDFAQASELWIEFSGPAFPKARGRYRNSEDIPQIFDQFSNIEAVPSSGDPNRPLAPPSTLTGVSFVKVGWKDESGVEQTRKFTFSHKQPHAKSEQIYPILEKLSKQFDLGFVRPK